MRTTSAWLLCTLLCAPAGALGQDLGDDGWITAAQVEEEKRERSPFAGSRLAVEMLEPSGSSRGQLITRGIFSNGDAVFSSNTAFSMEARVHLALVERLGITGVFPVGIVSPSGAETKFFVGNIGVGLAGGTAIDLVDPVTSTIPMRLRLGGGVEGIFPSAPSGSESTVAAALLVAALRAYEPHLYVPKLFAGRIRGQAGLSLGNLTAQLELSLVPGAMLEGDAVLLFGAAARASYEVTELVEPFLEMGATTQVAGTGQIRPPFMITPGVRFNISQSFRPAFFMSMNFVTANALMFGIDLAASMPRLDHHRRAEADDPIDFLPDS